MALPHKIFFFWFVLFLLFIPGLSAVTLSGQPLGAITYLPGTTITNSYQVSETNREIEVTVDRGPFSNITLSEVVDNNFVLTINFPEEEKVPTGQYVFSLTAREKLRPDERGIGALTSVSKSFKVIVYSYEKEINTKLHIPNINEGSNASFELGITSRGYPDIDAVRGEVTLYDMDHGVLGNIVTGEKPLLGLGGVSFTGSFDTQNYPASDYWAKAVVFYDGKQETTNTTFLIGNMDILVKNYTRQLEQGFSEFSALVENNWGNRLRNVYAKLFIGEQELLHTASIDLEPWKMGYLNGIVKFDGEPGEYQSILQIFYEGESKDVPVSLTVLKAAVEEVDPEEADKEIHQTRSLYLAISVAALILILVIVIIFFLKKIYFFKKTGSSFRKHKDEL